GEEHPSRAGLARHLHDLAARRAADDGIVDQQDLLALELHRDGVELLANGFPAHRMARHDEGAADVAILDEPLAIGDAEAARELHRRWPARVRNRDHD